MEHAITFFAVIGIYASVYEGTLLAQHLYFKWKKGGKK